VGVLDLRDNTDVNRFELLVDGTVAAFLEYRVRPGGYALDHAEAVPEFEGQGLSSEMIGSVLDLMRRNHTMVLPYCPFVVQYVQRHPEYLDVVAPTHRRKFGAGE
jgi:predicted GNAT family acetyltransferase